MAYGRQYVATTISPSFDVGISDMSKDMKLSSTATEDFNESFGFPGWGEGDSVSELETDVGCGPSGPSSVPVEPIKGNE